LQRPLPKIEKRVSSNKNEEKVTGRVMEKNTPLGRKTAGGVVNASGKKRGSKNEDTARPLMESNMPKKRAKTVGQF